MSSWPRVKHLQQPPSSNLCGQCCVAMLLDTTIDEVCGLMGKRGLTGTRHLRKALEARGWTLGDRINARKHRPEPSKLCVARVHWRKGGKRTHWVVMDGQEVVMDGQEVVDPAYGRNPSWTREGVSYTTSYYEVGPPPAPTE